MKKKETHEQKRIRLEAKLNKIGLTNYVVFGRFEGELLPAVYGDSVDAVNTILGALEHDPILLRTMVNVVEGLLEGMADQAGEGPEGKA